ncbi:MAG: DUF2637 domain-containing protein [Micromonosporaceae bacterium]|nr:DUF2637 domain-containing protein [Micromonosporaceae bacterium]
MNPSDVAQLRRIQWAVRATLVLGVAASVTANILHARPHPIAQAIAAWPPFALLITVELVSRVPMHRRSLGIIRIIATTGIAGIAAFVSYQHMAGVASRYGEVGVAPYLLPLSVDGLIIVASVSLAELAGRIRDIGQSSPVRVDIPHSLSSRAIGDQADSHSNPEGPPRVNGEDSVLPTDLAAILPAARAARDDLVREGRAVSRDALAARLRRDGHAIRNTRVSELIAVLKTEPSSSNGNRP